MCANPTEFRAIRVQFLQQVAKATACHAGFGGK